MANLESLTNFTLISLDVTSSEGIAATFDIVKAKAAGKPDYLVSNASSGFTMPFLHTDIAIAWKMFDINTWGVLSII